MVVGNDNREDGNLIQKLNRHINKEKNIGRKQIGNVTKTRGRCIYTIPVRNHTIFYLQF